MTEPLSDRRAAATAGGLVAAVVIVLGFGSGIGAVLSRNSGRAGAGSAAGQDRGTVVQQSGPVAATASAPTKTATASAASGASRSAMAGASSGGASWARTGWGSESSDPSSSDSTATTAASPGDSSGGTGATPAPCTGSSLVAAMVDPFVLHVDKAHLETSPGQQAHDALNVDSYVKTHTVLMENMLAPAVDAIVASLTGLQPFFTHFDKAHLERSPGEQVTDLLDVDQYTKTHTVLVENMAAPAMHELTDYGCP